MRGFRRLAASLLAAGLVLAGCSSGNDATVYGGSFTFTSPGGKSEFAYAQADRKTIGTLSGPSVSGNGTVDVSSYKGKVVVLNFWGSWCGPCRDEAPSLEDAYQKYKASGVQFVGIDVKDPQGAGQDFMTSKGITYPSIFDFGMRTMLSIRGLPTGAIPATLVLDKQGRVAHIWLDPITGGNLGPVLKTLIAEA